MKHIILNLFSEHLVPQDNNKDIYNLNSSCYHKIKIKPPINKKDVPQCKTVSHCSLGILKIAATKKSMCVTCGEERKPEDCHKPKKLKAKYANRGEAHTTN